MQHPIVRSGLYRHIDGVMETATTTLEDTKQQIAIQAYYLWETEGCQPGRDLEYWMRAKEIVAQRQQTMDRLTTPEENGSKRAGENRRGAENGKDSAKRSRKAAGALVE